MPINYAHSLFHRVEDGSGSISNEYAASYAERAWNQRSPNLVDDLENRVGGFSGKRVLDLAVVRVSTVFSLRRKVRM